MVGTPLPNNMYIWVNTLCNKSSTLLIRSENYPMVTFLNVVCLMCDRKSLLYVAKEAVQIQKWHTRSKKKKNINTMNPFLKMKVMVSLFLFFFFWCCSNFICPPPQNCYHKSHCSLTAAPRRQLNTNVILKCGWTSTERMKKWYLKGNISCIGGSPAWRNLFFCCCPANMKAAALIERHGNSPVYFPRCF